MADKSKVYIWLKSLSPSMKLECFSPEFENRGFRSRRSLAYVKLEDLDSFFRSPDKLLLACRKTCIGGRAEEHQIKNCLSVQPP